jgi:hypothetical protein
MSVEVFKAENLRGKKMEEKQIKDCQKITKDVTHIKHTHNGNFGKTDGRKGGRKEKRKEERKEGKKQKGRKG